MSNTALRMSKRKNKILFKTVTKQKVSLFYTSITATKLKYSTLNILDPVACEKFRRYNTYSGQQISMKSISKNKLHIPVQDTYTTNRRLQILV